MTYTCPQHRCVTCERNTAAAGGLLFRCESCTSAYCDDCLPEGSVLVGDELPQFLALGFGQDSKAYFIRCSDCVEGFINDPVEETWYNELQADARATLESL